MASRSRRASRASQQNHLTPAQAMAIGLVLIVAGGVPVLAALDVIETDDEDFGAPRWLVAVIAGVFPAAGFYLLCQGIAGLFDRGSIPERIARGIGTLSLHVLAWCFVVGLAIFFTMEFVSPGALAALEIFGHRVPVEGFVGGWLSRAVAGLGALFFDAILAAAVWNALKKRLAISSGAPTSPEARRAAALRRETEARPESPASPREG